MGPNFTLALARPYRPRPEWMEYLDLAFVAWGAAILVLVIGGACWRSYRQRKAGKHAALNRVRARQRHGS